VLPTANIDQPSQLHLSEQPFKPCGQYAFPFFPRRIVGAGTKEGICQ
jgi:hypothetical protein